MTAAAAAALQTSAEAVGHAILAMMAVTLHEASRTDREPLVQTEPEVAGGDLEARAIAGTAQAGKPHRCEPAAAKKETLTPTNINFDHI